ncbi:hypothetical protein CHARACLAT_003369 [Characodon lateralis]|uniref:Uncharacterized protein n=1 Tax=Characodon lateralis TaxID=208331 RepID=A0ABU7F0A0_9TELE|nr:hypothetical protein [Characodon lateralis]
MNTFASEAITDFFFLYVFKSTLFNQGCVNVLYVCRLCGAASYKQFVYKTYILRIINKKAKKCFRFLTFFGPTDLTQFRSPLSEPLGVRTAVVSVPLRVPRVELPSRAGLAGRPAVWDQLGDA